MARDLATFQRVQNASGRWIASYSYPDEIPAQESQFATLIPGRSPEFKVHRTEGLAHSALSGRNCGAKYKLIDGRWVKVWEWREPEACDNCGQPTPADKDWRYWYQRPRYYSGPSIEAPMWCRPCFESDIAKRKQAERERRERAELARLQDKYK